MNKFKKLAIASASMVMAGVMLVPLAACADNNEPDGPINYDPSQEVINGGIPNYNVPTSDGYVAKNSAFSFVGLASGSLSNVPSTGAEIVNFVNTFYMSEYQDIMNTSWARIYAYNKNGPSAGAPTQTKLTPATSHSGITLRMNVGDGSNPARQVSYKSGQISGNVQMLDGETYSGEAIKPVWKSIGKTLGVNFSNVATGLGSDAQIENNKDKLNQFDILTGSSVKIVENAGTVENPNFLDLNMYLDYMPNYKAFLDANPIIKLSLTSDTSSGAMYYAPYFDGNDDIEKYELMNHNWVKDLLERGALTSTTTFAGQAQAKKSLHSATNGYLDELQIDGKKAVAQAYMGSNDWSIETTDPSDVTKTLRIYVKYSKALEAVKDTSTGLGGAYNDIVGSAYTGESGNIMDIMNAAINAKEGAVTGAQLVKLLREYVDVTYCKDAEGTQKYYTNRADVFIGEDAAWDADLLTALSRCLVTNHSILTKNIKNANDSADLGIAEEKSLFAIAGRANTTQRNADLYGLAGELYGIRGMTSRYQFAYISGKENGALLDARTNSKTYDAMQSMHALVAEGLLYLNDNMNGTPSVFAKGKAQTMMMYDYVQTQTREGFNVTDTDKYNFSPVVTPVANWDTNSDGTVDTRMRFTESWRSVKNTGFCVPYASVKDDPAKLKAVLDFIDYLYSNDGQIEATFGPKATANLSKDGFWYATEASGVSVDQVGYKPTGSSQYTVKDEYKGQYFIYKGKVYTGTAYKGTQIPTLTDDVLNFFKGNEVTTANGKTIKISQFGDDIKGVATNYTDFARGFLGAALPIGNKNQGFEYQCTAPCALTGASRVGNALANGTVKHVQLQLSEKISDLWYTSVPTTLPYSTQDASTISTKYGTLTSTIFNNNSKGYRNILLDIMYYGYGYNK